MTTIQSFNDLQELFFSYSVYQRGLAQNTINGFRSDLATLKAFLSEKKIGVQDLTVSLMDEYINRQVKERQNSPPTIARKIETLKSFFKYLWRTDILIENVMRRIDSPKLKRKLPEFLSEEQQDQLIDYFDKRTSPQGKAPFIHARNKAMTILFLETGLRVGEMVNLRIRDVDFNRDVIRVLGKGQKEAEVYLPIRSKEALQDYIQNARPHILRRGSVCKARDKFAVTRTGKSKVRYLGIYREKTDATNALYQDLEEDAGFLFCSHPHKKMDTRAVFRVYNQAGQDLGFRIYPHLLRHTFASSLRQRGADLLLIKEAMRHASVNTTQIYAHISTERYRAEISKYVDNRPPVAKDSKVVAGPWLRR